MFDSGKYIKIIKLSAASHPVYPPANPSEFKERQYNPGKSPPNGLQVTGTLLKTPAIGENILIATDSINGQTYKNVWMSSQIKTISFPNDISLQIETANSVYLLILTLPNMAHEIKGIN